MMFLRKLPARRQERPSTPCTGIPPYISLHNSFFLLSQHNFLHVPADCSLFLRFLYGFQTSLYVFPPKFCMFLYRILHISLPNSFFSIFFIFSVEIFYIPLQNSAHFPPEFSISQKSLSMLLQKSNPLCFSPYIEFSLLLHLIFYTSLQNPLHFFAQVSIFLYTVLHVTVEFSVLLYRITIFLSTKISILPSKFSTFHHRILYISTKNLLSFSTGIYISQQNLFN